MVTFVVADLHFADPCAWAGRRDRFASLPDMEATIIDRWNATVLDQDTVFILGDVGKRKGLDQLGLLRGIKHLVAGNADDLGAAVRSGHFQSVTVVRWLPGAILSHVPVHPSQLRRGMVNIHGHLHSKRVDDPRYRCVSVDQTGYAPVVLGDLLQRPDRQVPA